MSFKEKCLYIPTAPSDSLDPKQPNTKKKWAGPTVKTWGSEGKGCFTWDERQKSGWNRWGIVDIKGDKRLLILDFDLYKMGEDQKKNIINAYNEKAVKTRVHNSLRGGMHLFYLVNPQNLNAKFDKEGNAKAELPVDLAENIDDKLNGYVLDPECEGYEIRVDREPAIINPKTDLPDEWLKETSQKITKTGEIEDSKLEKRLDAALSKDKKFKNLWQGDYAKAGFSDRSSAEASLASKIGFWFGRNEKTIEKLMEKSAAEKWHEREDRSYRDSIIQSGLKGEEEYSPSEKSEKKKVVETSKLEMGDVLAEEIITDVGPMFLYLNSGEERRRGEFDMGDTIYKPKIDDAVATESVLLPTGIEDYESIHTLVKEIQDVIHQYVDVSEQYEKLASWYVVMTWGYDRLSTLSYLRVLGDTGTGKSRFLNVVGRMCYKPIMVSGAVTPAPIYRLIKQWKGTLVIDEGDLRKSDEKNEVVTILNCGHERGRPVIRCTKDDPDNIQFFETFGPKLVATRQEFHDKALERRCLTEKTETTQRNDLPDQLPEEFYERVKGIRNKLLKWRLENVDNIDVSYSRKIDMGNLEPGLKQTTRCFFAIFKSDEVEEELLKFLRKHQMELVEQRAETWEGMILNTIYEKYWDNRKAEPIVTPGIISESISEEYGEDRLIPGQVGKILRSLDLETQRKRIHIEGKEEKVQRRVLVWDEEQMRRLFKRYVPGFADFVTVSGVVTVNRVSLPNVNANLYTWGQEKKERTPYTPSQRHSLSQKLCDLLNEDRPKVQEIPQLFDKEDIETVYKILDKWREGGTAYVDDRNCWRFTSD